MTLDPIEITATIFGLICVILTIKENIWCWPTGLVQVSLYIFVFFQARLYSDMGLHAVYVVMQFYGWYNWLHGGVDRTRLNIVRLRAREIAGWTVVAVAGTLSLGWIMNTYTNADLAYLDAGQTVLSLIAQWLMAKKVLESWLIWITVDVLSIGMYAVKHLYPTMGLYAVFLILAITGFWQWRKKMSPAWSSASSSPPTWDTSTSSTLP